MVDCIVVVVVVIGMVEIDTVAVAVAVGLKGGNVKKADDIKAYVLTPPTFVLLTALLSMAPLLVYKES